MKKKGFTIISAGIVACTLLVVSASQRVGDTNNEQVQYTDVSENDWYYNDVVNVTNKGLMNGTSDDLFSPSDDTNRAMVVTTLWRLEGEPEGRENSFTDVDKTEYYYDAVSWATENNIVSGYDAQTFAPMDLATREQLITIMHRYSSYKNYDTNELVSLDVYTDASSVSEYAVESFRWGVANGIITGTTDSTLSPKDNVKRCQVAAILTRFGRIYTAESINTQTPEQTHEAENIDSEPKPTVKPSGGGGSTSSGGGGSSSGGGGSSSGGGGSSSSGGDNVPEKPDSEADAETAVVSVGMEQAKPGDTVKVTLDITNNPGILGMVLTLEYDDSVMKLVNVENGEAVSGILSLTSSKTLESGARFLWDGLELNSEDIKDGTLLTMEFEILDGAVPANKYPLTIKYDSGDIIDANLNELDIAIQQGYIEIAERE